MKIKTPLFSLIYITVTDYIPRVLICSLLKHVSHYVNCGVMICDDSRKAISQALLEEMKNFAF